MTPEEQAAAAANTSQVIVTDDPAAEVPTAPLTVTPAEPEAPRRC